ncbi:MULTISPECIES: ATP-grasp domain-containing protein [Streptomyces]|uniref:ATP-grasp domain-containing protein n=1 Tax=Streptomyces solicathayae TaxID=3081768 RepID=A0ABZ0LQ47_9ACTN|nr:ATP-grasp domain-containing protein [Streptomyces sp. HUAS YS2]WOX21571.1 ATP-grasp domain-containing protein [Streptomyces sp. HUAS YS2]
MTASDIKRIAYIRSIPISRAGPYIPELARAVADSGREARIFYTDGDCGPEDFPGGTWEALPEDATPDQIVDRILAWGADGVVSLSFPDEAALRDAVVKARLAEHGIPMVSNGVEPARLLGDKGETKKILVDHGLDVPQGMLIDGTLLKNAAAVPAYADIIRLKAEEFGYPLLTKAVWGSSGSGIRFLRDRTDLEVFLATPDEGTLVMEQCITGELCTVELVGADGEYAVQPLCFTGPTGGRPTFAFWELRSSAPRAADDAAFAPVAEKLKKLCTTLGITGVINLDIIYSRGTYYVLEINPRVSGATALGVAASGRNTYLGMTEILLGEWRAPADPVLPRQRWSLEFPVNDVTDAFVREAEEALDVVQITPSLVVDGEEYGGLAIVTCEFGAEDAFLQKLMTLDATHHVLSEDMLSQLKELLTGPASQAVR